MTVTTPLSLEDLDQFIKDARKAGANWDDKVDASMHELSVTWVIEAPLGAGK